MIDVEELMLIIVRSRMVKGLLTNGEDDVLERLIEGIEQL